MHIIYRISTDSLRNNVTDCSSSCIAVATSCKIARLGSAPLELREPSEFLFQWRESKAWVLGFRGLGL